MNNFIERIRRTKDHQADRCMGEHRRFASLVVGLVLGYDMHVALGMRRALSGTCTCGGGGVVRYTDVHESIVAMPSVLRQGQICWETSN